jgi:hypothetical protein
MESLAAKITEQRLEPLTAPRFMNIDGIIVNLKQGFESVK